MIGATCILQLWHAVWDQKDVDVMLWSCAVEIVRFAGVIVRLRTTSPILLHFPSNSPPALLQVPAKYLDAPKWRNGGGTMTRPTSRHLGLSGGQPVEKQTSLKWFRPGYGYTSSK